MSLSRSPDFVKLCSGYTIAVIGSQITVLALPLTAVLLLGAGATETGLLVAARMLPALVIGLYIGAWVDRLPPALLMELSPLSGGARLRQRPGLFYVHSIGDFARKAHESARHPVMSSVFKTADGALCVPWWVRLPCTLAIFCATAA